MVFPAPGFVGPIHQKPADEGHAGVFRQIFCGDQLLRREIRFLAQRIAVRQLFRKMQRATSIRQQMMKNQQEAGAIIHPPDGDFQHAFLKQVPVPFGQNPVCFRDFGRVHAADFPIVRQKRRLALIRDAVIIGVFFFFIP